MRGLFFGRKLFSEISAKTGNLVSISYVYYTMKELLNEMIEAGFIARQKHESAELYIHNYTARAQYSKTWNEATLACRGLILDGEGNVKARPFKKFFNIEEHESLPAEPFEVWEKMDGSLGILYWVEGNPFIATRGSFVSEQARRATEMLHTKYREAIPNLNRDHTYLFEIIYPSNRIVINYGDREELVLLSVNVTETGEEVTPPEIGFPVVKKYDGIKDISELKALEEDNREGFVLRFESGLRVKAKFAEYVRLHRILTQVSSKVIWEILSEGRDLNELLDRVPDEFYSWVKQTVADLQGKYEEIEQLCKSNFVDLGDRKTNALHYQKLPYPSVLFKMLDGGDYSHIIWKSLKPEYAKPFKTEV